MTLTVAQEPLQCGGPSSGSPNFQDKDFFLVINKKVQKLGGSGLLTGLASYTTGRSSKEIVRKESSKDAYILLDFILKIFFR